ncbi:MAG: periplasmic heavy metal sensor [Rhodospirillaceae bacterium]|jgi:uncharacterized membrane protein|nr:periplasmic heavy metal sensor [Rhodospirillaceae bacterium]MBT6204748.1 periplasmic heavy metal sensor [Rhodospirillaceae bacterium]MBT6511318.1 periplasmic heavy metal sensor [Rhodospirillaceae bacterium]MBT7612574.1 periplasmic heavy metal sensor [Rhodospirillaceae bacterium]MBT7647951.1 periplasmic heavy metal sensor [Rhodospirillaceae bacterium]
MTQSGRLIRPLAIALVISLALNVFGVSWYLSREATSSWTPQAQGSWITRLAEVLPDEDQQTVADVVGAHKPQMEALFIDMRGATSAIWEAMAVDPMDEEQVEAALAEVRARQDLLHLELHETLLDLGRALPLEARQKLADHTAQRRAQQAGN